MKPNEFDDLLRQKFDQNDFEYNPRNWDRLEDQLDGRAKKRSIIMWWWVPLAGVAASVALAVGIPAAWQTGADKTGVRTEIAQSKNSVQPQAAQDMSVAATDAIATTDNNNTKPANKSKKHITIQHGKTTGDFIALTFHDAPADKSAHGNNIDLLGIGNIAATDKPKKKAVTEPEGFRTFKPEEEVQAVPKISIILSGGINRGSQNNGYMVGATIRKMLNDKVYIESDVAFANSNNTQSEGVYIPPVMAATAARHSSGTASKFSSDESSKVTTVVPGTGSIEQKDVTYNSSYAQVTPSIGYKLMKKMSIGVGPDFQQMLVDNRPVEAAGYRGNVQEAPSFDIGFVGKSEYALTKKIKAAVYYRKGVNSVISLNDKYIDRDYLQFQLKCTIFNK